MSATARQAVIRAPVALNVYLGAFSILKNKLVCYTDDSTLLSVMSSSGVRVRVAEPRNRDFGKVSEWCDLCGM